jgi:hypothetical protein
VTGEKKDLNKKIPLHPPFIKGERGGFEEKRGP